MAPTYFIQGCPTCGRRCQIRVEYLGKLVVCYHCRAQFRALDPSNQRPEEDPTGAAALAARIDNEIAELYARGQVTRFEDEDAASYSPQDRRAV